MNLPCDAKVQYVRSQRDTGKFRVNVEVAVLQDEFGHLILFVGPKERKQIFALERNITGVYDAFSKDGKGSVSLKVPEVNVFIQNADQGHLKLFMQLLKDIQQYPYLDIEVYAEQKKLPKRSETVHQRQGRKRKTELGDAEEDLTDLDFPEPAPAKQTASASATAGQQIANSILNQNNTNQPNAEEEEHDDDLADFIVPEDEELSQVYGDDSNDGEYEQANRKRKKRRKTDSDDDGSRDEAAGKKDEDSVPSEEI